MSEIYKLSGFQQELFKAERFFTMHLTRQELKNRLDEIERLNKQVEEYQKALDETVSEKIDLENIIKEVREYIVENMKEYGGDIYITCSELLEILDKENK